MQMVVLVGIESNLIISLSNLHVQLKGNRINSNIFDVCLVVGFEVHKVDSLII